MELGGIIEPSGQLPPEAGRYHLCIGLFCPFANRVNIMRRLKDLTELIDISIVKPYPKGDAKCWPGWKFATAEDTYEGATEDHLFQSKYLHEVYFKANKDYEGRYSVPVLWDRKTGQMLNNESLELLRNFNPSFNSILPDEFKVKDFYPENLRNEIEAVGAWMQSDLNTGVYKAGFAPVHLESIGGRVVKEWRAILAGLRADRAGPATRPTLIRFDTVYVQQFKCNLGTIRHDYPLLNQWIKNLYWNVPGFKETTDFRHIKENYTKSHADINPKAITPIGPIHDVENCCAKDWSKLVELP